MTSAIHDTRFERLRLTLTPRSPIHVSAGGIRLGTGFVTDGDWLYGVDETRLAAWLKAQGLFERYLGFVEEWTQKEVSTETFPNNHDRRDAQDTKDNTLQVFLELRKLDEAFVYAIKDTADRFPFYNPENGPVEFIRNGHGEAYLPGTALKGAIRTALMAAVLAHNAAKINLDVEANLRRANHAQKEQLGEELNAWIFQDYDLLDSQTGRVFPEPSATQPPRPGPHTDFMKAIAVSDSTPIPEAALEEMNIRLLSLRQQEHVYEKRFGDPIIREVYRAETPVSFDLTLDRERLSTFSAQSRQKGLALPFTSLADVLAQVRTFYAHVWQEDGRFFGFKDQTGAWHGPVLDDDAGIADSVGDFYTQHEAAHLRLGYGSGLLGTTLFSLLSDTNRTAIRNLIMPNAIPIAPKSRRLAFGGDPQQHLTQHTLLYPLGWATLSF